MRSPAHGTRRAQFFLQIVPLLFVARSLAAQVPDTLAKTKLPGVVVTATRTPKTTFDVPAPVNFMNATTIQTSFPNSAADLFREQPGLDVSGVGTNQVRPIVRGQRGQRIILLEDDIRLNNSRRQQDFGELPSLVAVSDLERVEVVRGPLSVLYGTDAIGGVVNLITQDVADRGRTGPHGNVGYLYGSADRQHRGNGALEQRWGRFGYRVAAAWRETDAYTAPAGSYGNVTFHEREKVNDTGVRDAMYSGLLSYDLTPTQRLRAKFEPAGLRIRTVRGYGYMLEADGAR